MDTSKQHWRSIDYEVIDDTKTAQYEGWRVVLSCSQCGTVWDIEDDVSNGEKVKCPDCNTILKVTGR